MSYDLKKKPRISTKRYPHTSPKRIESVLKKFLKKFVAIIATTSVKTEMLKDTSEYSPFTYIAEFIAEGASERPITMITEPITTGGKALEIQFFPTILIMHATMQ